MRLRFFCKGDSMSEKYAEEILSRICYATLATATQTGVPWSSPVYTAFDSQWHFFWISSYEARHSQNIRENSQIACVIYDSTAPEGTGTGIYIQARAGELVEEVEVAHGLHCLWARAGEAPPPVSYALGASPLRIYRAVPDTIWTNTKRKVNGVDIDKRIELHPTLPNSVSW